MRVGRQPARPGGAAGQHPLHVALFLSTLGFIRGGLETKAAAIAGGLAARGHRVHVVTGRWPGRRPPGDVRALPLVEVPAVPAGLGLWRPVRGRRPGWPVRTQSATFYRACTVLPATRRLLASADVTVTMLPWETAPFSAHRSRAGRANLSYTPGGGRRWLAADRSVVRLTVPLLSEEDPDLGDFPVDGVLPPLIPDDWLARPYEVRPHAERLLFVGRLEANKGVDLAVDLLAGLPDGSTVLRLVGDGPQRRQLTARAAAAGLAGRVRFAGAVDREAVRREMAAADLLVHPSRHELLPSVLMEAQAVGLPIVASDILGIRDAVNPEACLVPPGEVAAWVAAAAVLLDDPARRARMSAAGRDWASPYRASRVLDEVERFVQLAAARAHG